MLELNYIISISFYIQFSGSGPIGAGAVASLHSYSPLLLKLGNGVFLHSGLYGLLSLAAAALGVSTCFLQVPTAILGLVKGGEFLAFDVFPSIIKTP